MVETGIIMRSRDYSGPERRRRAIASLSVNAAVDGWAKVDGIWRLLLMADGTVYAGDPHTLDTLARAKEFVIEKQRLVPSDPRLRERYLDFLRVGLGDISTLLVPLKSPRAGHWICRATWTERADKTALIAASFRLVDQCRGGTWPDLTAAFGLTVAEDLVLRELLEGSTPKAVATRHGLSINTIRTHLRNCYDKLAVSNREDLWRRLASYQIWQQ